jgi:catalase
MASTILANITDRTKEAMSSASSKKVEQLSSVTKDVHDGNSTITSDYGVKQSNTDAWLKVASEDQNGPLLLEDPFGREKVSWRLAMIEIGMILTLSDPPLRP